MREKSRFSPSESVSHGLVSSNCGKGCPFGPLRVAVVPIGFTGGSSVSGGTRPISFCRASVCSRIAS